MLDTGLACGALPAATRLERAIASEHTVPAHRAALRRVLLAPRAGVAGHALVSGGTDQRRRADRIAGGRVPITLKLLSPARRPMQITRDLAGFWKGSYAEVRKDMHGRYPRHYWPENPLEAEPVRGVRPKGS